MKKRMMSTLTLMLLVTSMLALAFHVQPVRAEGTVRIRTDGSIDPPTSPILTTDNVTYTLIGNISSDTKGIVVERNNTIIDGAGYEIQGMENASSLDYTGIDISGTSNVTIQNINVCNFTTGILSCNSSFVTVRRSRIINNEGCGMWLENSSGDVVSGNAISENEYQGIVLLNCPDSTIVENNLSRNYHSVMVLSSSGTVISQNEIIGNGAGIQISSSDFSVVADNNITDNTRDGSGVSLGSSDGCVVFGNRIANNLHGISIGGPVANGNTIHANSLTGNGCGLLLTNSSGNRIYHNNIISNYEQVRFYWRGFHNSWDNGYPSGGNCWSDYAGLDADNDGIGDAPYVYDADNVDNYPMMGPFSFFDAGTWNDTAYYVDIVSNSTLSHFHFNPDEGAFASFWVNDENETETLGFCRVAIPKSLLWVEDGWTVLYGSSPLSYRTFSDEYCTYLYFTYPTYSSEVWTTVSIHGTHSIPEFQSFLIIPLFFIAMLLAATVYRRKHRQTN